MYICVYRLHIDYWQLVHCKNFICPNVIIEKLNVITESIVKEFICTYIYMRLSNAYQDFVHINQELVCFVMRI